MLANSDRAQMLLWAAVALALLWTLYLLGPVLTPFLAGAMLAYILNPGVEWLCRHRVFPGVLGINWPPRPDRWAFSNWASISGQSHPCSNWAKPARAIFDPPGCALNMLSPQNIRPTATP